MNITFPKDLLMIDFESTLSGTDENTEPVQIGAVLLDKNTLKEIKSFSSFIKADLSKVPPERTTKKWYDIEKINSAPTQAEVAQKFLKIFGKDYFIGSFACTLDIKLFKKIMFSVKIPFSDFDYHVYDIWPVAYTYLLQHGYQGSWRSEEMFREFGLPPRGSHDALEDCRYAAEVLRKILEK